MQYRRFGKTGLNVSVFSLGLMRYMQDDPEQSAEVVRRAVQAGINHLETARGYGTSEELLGYALKSMDRGSVLVTSKARPKATYDEFMRDFETSMSQLGLDYLDNFDLHGINNQTIFEWAMDERQTWRAVRKLLDSGVIRHVGFSTHAKPDLLMQVLDTQMFESVNLHYYWFYQLLEPCVARAAELDMGVFIISPNNKGGMLYQPPPKLAQLSAPLHPMTVNARWLLSKPFVHTLSLGAATAADLDMHLAIADQTGPLTPLEEEILDRWASARRESLGKDHCTQCQKCLPCPVDIDIPELLRLRGAAVGLDMTDYGSFRYNLLDGSHDWFHGTTGDHCTECGECLPRCPEKLEIPRLLFDTHDLLKTGTGRRLWA